MQIGSLLKNTNYLFFKNFFIKYGVNENSDLFKMSKNDVANTKGLKKDSVKIYKSGKLAAIQCTHATKGLIALIINYSKIFATSSIELRKS